MAEQSRIDGLFSETDSDEEPFQGFAARDTRPHVEVATKATLFRCSTPIKRVRHESSSRFSDCRSLSSEEDVSQSPNVSIIRRPPVISTAEDKLSSSSLEGETATATSKSSELICSISSAASVNNVDSSSSSLEGEIHCPYSQVNPDAEANAVAQHSTPDLRSDVEAIQGPEDASSKENTRKRGSKYLCFSRLESSAYHTRLSPVRFRAIHA